MNSKTIKEQLGIVQGRLTKLDNLLETEDRTMTTDEQTAFDADFAELERLSSDLDKAEKYETLRAKEASRVGVSFSKPTKEEKEKDELVRDFTFGAAVRAAYGEKLDGVEAEMHQEGMQEMQRIGQSSSGIVIPSMILNRAVVAEADSTGIEAQNFVQGVYAKTVLGDLGVTRVNTSTDQRIPIIPSVTTQWETEVSDAADGGNVLTKIDLAPKRLASYLDFTKQAAMQSNYSIESALRAAFQESIAAKVEYACFTDDTANGSYEWLYSPAGVDKTAITSATASTAILGVIEEVMGNNHNFGNLGFALSADLYAALSVAVKVSGVNALLNDSGDMLMGRKAKFSSQLAQIGSKDAFYYGNWSKVQIAQFGGIEILTDPYTQAIGGKTRLVLNSYWDMAITQAAAISVGTIG